MPNILITGAASGLGRAFTRAYARHLYAQSINDDSNNNAEESESFIYSTDRDKRILRFDHTFPKVTDFSSGFGRWVQGHWQGLVLDVTDEVAVRGLFDADNGALGRVSLDLVVHSTGVRGLVGDGTLVEKYEDVRDCENRQVMDKRTMMKAFEINVQGTFELLRGCVPGLKRATSLHHHDIIGKAPPKVIVMGSRMGSIAHNAQGNANSGGAYAYRASKAALNAVVRSFAVDVPEAIWVVVHPGRVETGLVRVKEDGAMTTDESIEDMIQLIGRLRKEHSGRFVDRFGLEIPW